VETSLARALIALHYQNDICHPDGKIPFAIDRKAPMSSGFLEASRKALGRARQLGFVIAHVHIAFSSDYADLPRHGRLFRKVAELGAVKIGSWGVEAYEGSEPLPGETCLIHKGNSAFFATVLDEILEASAVTDLTVCGLATQFSVEHPYATRPTAAFGSRSLGIVALRPTLLQRGPRSKSCRCWRKWRNRRAGLRAFGRHARLPYATRTILFWPCRSRRDYGATRLMMGVTE
jgi:biuret amidohydrolase